MSDVDFFRLSDVDFFRITLIFMSAKVQIKSDLVVLGSYFDVIFLPLGLFVKAYFVKQTTEKQKVLCIVLLLRYFQPLAPDPLPPMVHS